MSTVTTNVPDVVDYPEDDGLPMSDNTLQYRWITTIEGGLNALFKENPDVFVAGNLLWYPVEGNNLIRSAPDAMVVFGRPKGDRPSYLQWKEGGISPQVVFEVLSPGNRLGEMNRKFRFYQKYGVEEYYIYDPDRWSLRAWQRQDKKLQEVSNTDGWVSPRLGIRFDLSEGELRIFGPDGELFTNYAGQVTLRQQVEQKLERTEEKLEQAEEKIKRLAAKLRELGLDPDA